jgi:AGZA family xanthine/uracil permease-like MFS transporter
MSRHRAAFVVGIGFVTVISWFRGTAITYFPYNEAGDARFDYFKQVVSIEPVNQILAPFTGDLAGAAGALITFLYVDFLDTSVSKVWVLECEMFRPISFFL